MPALILIVPLIFAYMDQRTARPVRRPEPPAIIRSYDLPPNTEIIYFVVS